MSNIFSLFLENFKCLIDESASNAWRKRGCENKSKTPNKIYLFYFVIYPPNVQMICCVLNDIYFIHYSFSSKPSASFSINTYGNFIMKSKSIFFTPTNIFRWCFIIGKPFEKMTSIAFIFSIFFLNLINYYEQK